MPAGSFLTLKKQVHIERINNNKWNFKNYCGFLGFASGVTNTESSDAQIADLTTHCRIQANPNHPQNPPCFEKSFVLPENAQIKFVEEVKDIKKGFTAKILITGITEIGDKSENAEKYIDIGTDRYSVLKKNSTINGYLHCGSGIMQKLQGGLEVKNIAYQFRTYADLHLGNSTNGNQRVSEVNSKQYFPQSSRETIDDSSPDKAQKAK